MKNSDPVWYACYGSNVYSERFKHYIIGGQYRGHGRNLEPCEDPTLWRDFKVIRVPGRMHFAKEKSSWGNYGVAFFRPEEEGTTIMKLYLVTEAQFRHIRKKEGASDHWYGWEYPLGEIDGIPVRTLTSRYRIEPENLPCGEYLDTIRNGLVLECGLTEEEAEKYLHRCLSPMESENRT